MDTFQVQSIAELNSFSCLRVESKDKQQSRHKMVEPEKSIGIWLQALYANHSCLLNVTSAFIGDIIIIRAA